MHLIHKSQAREQTTKSNFLRDHDKKKNVTIENLSIYVHDICKKLNTIYNLFFNEYKRYWPTSKTNK